MFFVGHLFFDDDAGPSADPENLTMPCSTADAALDARLETNLIGDPAPTIENATVTGFDVEGEEWLVVVAPLIDLSGGRDDSAVFIIDPSDAVFAYEFPDDAMSAAQTYSSFEAASLDAEVWQVPIDYAIRCDPLGG